MLLKLPWPPMLEYLKKSTPKSPIASVAWKLCASSASIATTTKSFRKLLASSIGCEVPKYHKTEF